MRAIASNEPQTINVTPITFAMTDTELVISSAAVPVEAFFLNRSPALIANEPVMIGPKTGIAKTKLGL